MGRFIFTFFCLFSLFLTTAQKKEFLYTRADSLRGSLRKERNFDVKKYNLDVTVMPKRKFIKGVNIIDFVPLDNLFTIQLDLFENMVVDSIIYKGTPQDYKREYNAVFVHFKNALKKDSNVSLSFYFSGYPIIAKNAPWDGGFVFSKDINKNPWIATACQGIGASLWWPNKDHQSDEPDRGVSMSISVPEGLIDVSNGRFVGSKQRKDGYVTWQWSTSSPINNYNLALNIGDYVHFGETYKGLDFDYYVLRGNKYKAKSHFNQVKSMMDCFQKKFGEYPFKKDGYKLVETPFFGMEHQSAIAYGNKYKMGYNGSDLSGTGIGLKWDFIIIHETAHEWFGNSITSQDIADMWIHESFASYAESVYIECHWGYKEALAYINGTSKRVKNDRPIIGNYGVNNEGSRDMYPKGALMINTLRHIIHNDDKWWRIIKAFSIHFKYKIITTGDVISFFEKEATMPLKSVFDQYLRYLKLPVLELKQKGKSLMYRWAADVKNFQMPIDVNVRGAKLILEATNQWQKLRKTSVNDTKVDTKKFFIKVRKL